MSRLDAFSDLDFFVIVEESAKPELLNNLDWLNCGSPLTFSHRNTVDGWKTLDAEGIFCEFAVFHPGELAQIPFSLGRVIWAREGFDVRLLAPTRLADPVDVNWAAREALTNILIGLKRYLRGEHHAARRAIVVDAAEHTCRAIMADHKSDAFNPWRRMEFEHPANSVEMQTILDQPSLPQIVRGLLIALGSRATLPKPFTDEIERHLDVCNAP